MWAADPHFTLIETSMNQRREVLRGLISTAIGATPGEVWLVVYPAPICSEALPQKGTKIFCAFCG